MRMTGLRTYLAEEIPAYCGTQGFITVVHILSQTNPVHTLPSYFFKKAYRRLLFVGVTRGSNKVIIFTDANDMVESCFPYDVLPSFTKITGLGYM
jgi:hypothetical protein